MAHDYRSSYYPQQPISDPEDVSEQRESGAVKGMGWLRDASYRARRTVAALAHPREAAERTRDGNYREWAARRELGQVCGNPPASRALDADITLFACKYPEFSGLDRGQAAVDADADLNADYAVYPPYEGPGFTEPPLNWEGWHQPHSDYEKDHYWDRLDRPWLDPDADRDVEAGF